MSDADWKNDEKTKVDVKEDPVARLHDYHLDVQNNHLYLFPWQELAATDTYGWAEPGVEYTMANKVIMNMRLAMTINPNKPLMIHMKTCGGLWEEGMAIFDMLLCYPYDTTILSYTHARSMSSIIFQAATKRVMMPHSTFMFHDGTYGDEGTYKQVKTAIDFYEKVGSVMMDIYVFRMMQRGEHSHKTEKQIRKMLRDMMDKKEDVYLTAQEAVSWGLADEVFNGNWSNLTNYSTECHEHGQAFAAEFLK